MINDWLENIKPGSLLVVHAAFKPLAVARYTPEQVIDAILDRLRTEGTLMMPTFTYSYSGIWNVRPFDPATTPGVLNGVLSEAFRQRPGVVRSAHPTYSVAAYGKMAGFLTQNREHTTGLGHGSSYEDAMRAGAQILLLNVGNNRNSMLHYVEVAAELPYNDIPFRECWGRTALTIHGEIELVPEFPACSDKFEILDAELVEAGIARAFSCAYLIDAQSMCDYVMDRLKRQPDFLLCNNFTCEPCTLRRKRLRERGMI